MGIIKLVFYICSCSLEPLKTDDVVEDEQNFIIRPPVSIEQNFIIRPPVSIEQNFIIRPPVSIEQNFIIRPPVSIDQKIDDIYCALCSQKIIDNTNVYLAYDKIFCCTNCRIIYLKSSNRLSKY
uniref:Uncharacterized protein n=1 Tax=viral metagenome TaxID=1070528 RepID=A0A6C0DAN9_9ZZZZ